MTLMRSREGDALSVPSLHMLLIGVPVERAGHIKGLPTGHSLSKAMNRPTGDVQQLACPCSLLVLMWCC